MVVNYTITVIKIGTLFSAYTDYNFIIRCGDGEVIISIFFDDVFCFQRSHS
ncbi:hypothetical protein Ark11_1505 [Candidatus Ichthyocystis hellenicum]|uniref:Uncharacterized protein n=1 Tax=Candidatus Ichthyocystis hellenicum TaxID=1561003 RepID=A0A0S4M5F1_9BURK|nr:hypothetical protein Ark11_1505 [Candidatus Ichthyocystis hellenicum]